MLTYLTEYVISLFFPDTEIETTFEMQFLCWFNPPIRKFCVVDYDMVLVFYINLAYIYTLQHQINLCNIQKALVLILQKLAILSYSLLIILIAQYITCRIQEEKIKLNLFLLAFLGQKL